IEELTIPGTVKTLGSFGDCTSLRSVVIEEGVEQSSFGAFKDCESLTEVSIPKSVRRIGLNAFQNTPWLNSQTGEFVTVGDGVLIRYNGTGKTELTIPAGIKSVCCTLGFTHEFRRLGNDTDDSANMTNPNLETVVFGPDVKEIYGACYGLRKLHSVVLPEGVESIGEYSFFQCDSLKEITLPESLRYLFWKQTFGTFRTDPEGFAGELYEENMVDSGYPYGPTPTVIFLGAPPTVHPDEHFYEDFHVMWDGDGQALTELAYDLSPGVIWHLRYSLKYAAEWESFEPERGDGVLIWSADYITFAQQYDVQPYLLRGDANMDGSVTSADAALILRHVIGFETLADTALQLADVNGDGKITAADAAMILRFVVGLIHTL
ncbi:MAG: leucine-rich repeat protein, partial [Clostridia bacterium]|nr:leucine-rich repeat protein [Clostridia bacterium]